MAVALAKRGRASRDAVAARQLIAAAADLMRERDTLDISFVDISARANQTPGLIAYYFGNKEGLLYAVLEDSISDALKQLDALIHSDWSASDKMRLHLNGVVTAYFRAPFFNRLLQAMTRDASPERVTMIAERMIRPMTEAQGRIIDDGLASGEFRPVDKMLFFFATVGAADGLHASRFILNSVFGQEIDAPLNKRSAATIVELFMRGLRREP